MWGQTKQATSATTALIYVTAGALTDVWSAVYYVYLTRHTPAGDNAYLWCAGFFCTGLCFIIIGLAVGRIGRSALNAETAATPTQVVTTPTVAAVPPTPPAPAATLPAAPAPNAVAPPPAIPRAPAAPVPARPVASGVDGRSVP